MFQQVIAVEFNSFQSIQVKIKFHFFSYVKACNHPKNNTSYVHKWWGITPPHTHTHTQAHSEREPQTLSKRFGHFVNWPTHLQEVETFGYRFLGCRGIHSPSLWHVTPLDSCNGTGSNVSIAGLPCSSTSHYNWSTYRAFQKIILS